MILTRFILAGLALCFSLVGHSQKNMHYPSDTTIFTNIEGHFEDTVLNYYNLYKQKTIKLKASNPDFQIVEFSVMWQCPEVGWLDLKGDTLSHFGLKHFGGSNFGLYIFRVLAKNKQGYYFWIRDRYYSFRE
jgi:hypothetical protein